MVLFCIPWVGVVKFCIYAFSAATLQKTIKVVENKSVYLFVSIFQKESE